MNRSTCDIQYVYLACVYPANASYTDYTRMYVGVSSVIRAQLNNIENKLVVVECADGGFELCAVVEVRLRNREVLSGKIVAIANMSDYNKQKECEEEIQDISAKLRSLESDMDKYINEMTRPAYYSTLANSFIGCEEMRSLIGQYLCEYAKLQELQELQSQLQ